MKPTLVIHISGADIGDDTPIAWHVFGAAGDLQHRGTHVFAALPEALSSVFAEGETLVLVPGELVLMSSVRIPSRQMRQIKQALPYMVEELIADNIEEVHLALPDVKPDDNAAMPVGVVRHSLLINWLDQLYQHRIKPDWLCPDSMAVPWREHSRSFFVAGERIIFRSERFSAQVFYRQQAAVYLQLLQRQFAADELGAVPRYVVSSGIEDASAARELQQLIETQLGVDVELSEYTETGAEVMATDAIRERESSINLLQGGYAVQRKDSSAQWLRTLKIAAAVLAVYIGVSAVSGLWYAWRAEKLQDQSFALYHQLFPQERRVVSPKKQMQAHLHGGAAQVSPLPLLTKTALGLRNNTMQLDELRYNQQQDDIQLQLRAPNMEALDQIKRQLSGIGLNVEIKSAAQRGEETLGRIHVRES